MGRITVLSPGVKPRIHTILIWLIVHIARPFNYRGVQRLSWVSSRIFSHEDQVAVAISPDTRLIVPLRDGYWTYLLDRKYQYEPEIAQFLRREVSSDVYFLDCGANIGIWSLLMRGLAKGVVSVEASPTTFRRLQANAHLNRADMALVHAALMDRAGESVAFFDHALEHAGATIREDSRYIEGPGWHSVLVPTTTLRDLVDTHCLDDSARIIVKLDVEGAEIAAIKGAEDLFLERRVLLIYEDHGSDPLCLTTRYLQEHGFTTSDLSSGRPLTLEQISARKTKPWRGYNFLAYQSR